VDRTKVNPIVLKAMSRAAVDVPKILATLPIGQPVNGWFIPSSTMGVYGTDYSLRAYVARNGLTANTPKKRSICKQSWMARTNRSTEPSSTP